MSAILHDRYKTTILPELRKQFEHGNPMEVARLEKIVINMGVGDGQSDARMLENAVNELTAIAGQRPVVRKARKSIANFKLREGASIACMVTLRGQRMYEFLDRLLNVAIPRIRDFRGLSPKSFDGLGNYTMGVREQLIFPEIEYDTITSVRGMNITFVIS